MTEIHELTALQLAAAVRRRDFSPLDVVDHTLERAERLGEQVGAFVTLTPELAREQARAAERTVLDLSRQDLSGRTGASGQAGELSGLTSRLGERRKPSLLGVPCPIKDLNMVAGVPVSAGSAAYEGTVATYDDGIVTLLREAGTLMVGKTTTPEFGLPCYTEPDIAPPARTPWDLSRSAGGSSGGAAAAVAAGIVPVAQGSDGGGSLRIPASACGVVGFKASRGRVSPGPHGVEGPGLAIGGVLTRDVRDTAALLDMISEPWPGDLFMLPPPWSTFLDACDRPVEQLRVGVLTAPAIAAGAAVDQACLDAVSSTAALLDELGHHVEPAPVPFPAERWASFEALWAVLALSVPVPEESEKLLMPLTRWLRDKGRSVTGLEYAQAVSAVQSITREAAGAWERFDVVVSPTLARLPAPLGSLRNDDDPAADFMAQTEFTPWTSVWNLTGWPAVSLPLHRARVEGADGGPDGVTLPVGVMVGAPALGADETVLSLAAPTNPPDVIERHAPQGYGSWVRARRAPAGTATRH